MWLVQLASSAPKAVTTTQCGVVCSRPPPAQSSGTRRPTVRSQSLATLQRIVCSYLIATSRLLPKPLSGIFRAQSGCGKSYLMECVAELMPPEEVHYFSRLTPQALYYVNTLTVARGAAGGVAIADFAFAASEDSFTYNVVLSDPTLSPWGGYAAAHELGHLLTNGGHEDASGVFPLWHLMQPNVLDTSGISGSRRLKQSDATKILSNSHAH